MLDNFCQSFFFLKRKNSQGARKGKEIMAEKQTEALTLLLIDAGIMLGNLAQIEIDARLQQDETESARREQVQQQYINMHQYDIEIVSPH